MPEDVSSNGHRGRLRDKYLRTGGNAFLDYELLELLLSYAIARKDVKPVAKTLLQRFGSLSGVIDAEIPELTECEGVGQTSAIQIKIIRTLMVRYLSQGLSACSYMDDSDKFCEFARQRLGEYANEAIMVFYLNTRNRLIDTEVLGEGTENRLVVYPSVIAKHSLLRNAKSIVICHNHPSGIVAPSQEDTKVTLEIRRALEPLEIFLLDHIIVSPCDYYSFRYADKTKPPAQRVLAPLK